MESKCRCASHAGSWYIGNPAELGKQIDGWCQSAASASEGKEVACAGVIAPHAGYSYSGPNAAFAFMNLRPSPSLRTVFILGPSHSWYVPSCALPEATEYETPFCNLPVNTEVLNALRATNRFHNFPLRRDEREHSLEMHLPFIAHRLRGHPFNIVPILVGAVSTAQEKEFGELLAPYLDDPNNFFVVSSDFCHWGSRFDFNPTQPDQPIHQTISDLDHEGMRLIEALDTTSFASYLQRTQNTICGRHPIAVYMHALQASTKQWDLQFVKYDQSSKVIQRNDSSVSYASAVVTEKS